MSTVDDRERALWLATARAVNWAFDTFLRFVVFVVLADLPAEDFDWELLCVDRFDFIFHVAP